ncbi:MAG: A/G-specific adenine glycosylase, partial [Rhabdochlamydiaceae bacterium]|nr:A/G-specific adenine glycosylase [Rhabdochlamydiaceae bacterium]
MKEWFLSEQRDLPWREDRSPYRVWISEVMLQQTQVAVVIPYFHRWMKKFPTLESLASASQEEVIKAWEGLGYYSRARNLHKAAQYIMTRYQGVIPSSALELQELPGFGPYTVGALRSFAFKQKAAAVDGNVVRVLSRFFASSHDCSKRVPYEEMTCKVLPEEEPWVVMEGLIELGAQICQKKPKCQECPLMEDCKAYGMGRVLEFPILRKRPSIIQLKRQVALIMSGTSVLIRQEKEKKVMSGLYEFPYASLDEELPLKISLDKIADFPVVKHGFTRYDV